MEGGQLVSLEPSSYRGYSVYTRVRGSRRLILPGSAGAAVQPTTAPHFVGRPPSPRVPEYIFKKVSTVPKSILGRGISSHN